MKFLDKEINKKAYVIILIICIAIIILLIFGSYLSFFIPRKYVMEDGTIETKENMNTHIDVLENSGIREEIAGWAYKEGKGITTINSAYVIKNEESGEMYILNTRYENNNNVEEKYKNAGIHSRFLLLGLKKGRYDIYVLYKNNDDNYLVNTDIYFENL